MADEVAENPAADGLGEGSEVQVAEVGLEEDEAPLIVQGKGAVCCYRMEVKMAVQTRACSVREGHGADASIRRARRARGTDSGLQGAQEDTADGALVSGLGEEEADALRPR